MLCIEIDENQHKKYIKCDENIRYDNLFMDFNGKYIFIRYNLDKFIYKYNTSKNLFFQKEWTYQRITLKNIYTDLNIV